MTGRRLRFVQRALLQLLERKSSVAVMELHGKIGPARKLVSEEKDEDAVT
jgi:hypothetical protein